MAAHFESRKWAYRQTKEGTVISFLVHPNDISSELATAPLGTRYMVAFAAIGDDEKPLLEPKQEKPKTPFNQMSRAQQAGILCADERFQKWLGVSSEGEAADWVRWRCIVPSRSELDDNGNAAGKWDDLVVSYRIATGQQAEPR